MTTAGKKKARPLAMSDSDFDLHWKMSHEDEHRVHEGSSRRQATTRERTRRGDARIIRDDPQNTAVVPTEEGGDTVTTTGKSSSDGSSENEKPASVRKGRENLSSSNEKPTFTERWIRAQECLSRPLKLGLVALAMSAARHPRKYIVGIIGLSFGLAAAGYFTNFQIENRDTVLWKPIGSRTEAHEAWVENTWKGDSTSSDGRRLLEANDGKRVTIIVFNKKGDNIVSLEGQRKNFDAIDFVQRWPKYDKFCARNGGSSPCPRGCEFVCEIHGIPFGDNVEPVCQIAGPTTFWWNNYTVFERIALSDQDVKRQLSVDTFPGEFEQFSVKDVIGRAEFSADGTIVSGQSYLTVFEIDRGAGRLNLIKNMINKLLTLRDEWNDEVDNEYGLEVFSWQTFADEINRSVLGDLPLVPIVFVIMCVFTCIAFSKCDWVHSQSLLGFGAVSCVLLAILAGNGLMWVFGVPFTTLTQVLPFILFGIGLDDAFILMHAYGRTTRRKDVVDRVRDTMEEVGMSILMTTSTSVFAFALGCLSSLPAIRWLCIYAAPMIAIDFIFQITFFIALVVIDERRVQDKRRDWLVCFTVKNPGIEGEEVNSDRKMHVAEKCMDWYADKLLKPWVKALVLVSFTGLLVVFALSASQLKLEFDFTDMLARDSYIIPFFDALKEYTEAASITPTVYFRNVDHSDPMIRLQMDSYVTDLVGLESVTERPINFWLDDFNVFSAANQEILDGLSFADTMLRFLGEDQYRRYRNDFKYDAEGNIMASRTTLSMHNLNQTDIDEQLRAFHGQRKIGREQPINQNGGDWPFFTFTQTYITWEFLAGIVDELTLTAILGISAVSAMALLFIPHWSGILFIGPLVSVLYVDLMGLLQFAGVSLDGVTYVALTMSIGLLVDFVMHVAHKYFASTEIGRLEKTKDVLRTMGASVLLGGLSTFLGTLPLAFASILVFRTIFITFAGIVLLGLAHGLILFPVLLSLIGPQ